MQIEKKLSTPTFGVSEIARILKVKRDTIQYWSNKFKMHLNPLANPGKGISRQFIKEDICVFFYIATYWENDPDIENIEMGLSAREHFEEPYSNLLVEFTPIFGELPDNFESGMPDVLFGGAIGYLDKFKLADSYKYAADKLVDILHGSEEENELFCPAIFNYRHSIELYLKAITGEEEWTHDLKPLYHKFKTILSDEFKSPIPNWFESLILTFNEVDPGGTTFRYANFSGRDETFADLMHLKTLMR